MATSSSQKGSNSRGLMLLLLTSSFFLGGLLFHYMPMIVDNQIKRQIELATNEEILSFWTNPPIDLNSYYWLYEVMNHDQFMEGEKVRVRKVGPYHFTSRIEKRIIELSANKYRIFYNTTRHIRLNETAARLAKMDEQMWLVNPIYVSMVEGIREFSVKMDPQMRPMVVASINRLTEKFNESVFVKASPREFLVGRRVELFDKLRKFASTFSDGQPMPGMPEMPDIVKGDTFGLVSVQNNSWTGPFEVYTGYQASQPSLGEIISYKGRRRLTEFSGRCNRLQASAGELRPMPVLPDQILELYQPPLCRIVHLKPTGVKKVREGQAIAYQLAPEDFLSAEQNPDNRCYCVNGTTNNYCSLNGVLETGPCSMWSPLVVTMNNMVLDSRITDTIQDFEPDLLASDVERLPKADNQSQMLILRRLGVPVQVDLTTTIFMKVIRDPQFRQTTKVPEVSYVPMTTIRETVTLPPKLGQIIVDLESFLALTQHLKVVMYLSSLVLLCWLAGHYFSMASRDRVLPSNGPGEGSAGGETDETNADSHSGTTSDRRGRDGQGGNGEPSGEQSPDNNSIADSLRSQRPSRVSQSSVDPGALSLASGGNGLSNSGVVSSQAVASGKVDLQQKQQQQKLAIVFSQVDEERALQAAAAAAKSNSVWPEARQSIGGGGFAAKLTGNGQQLDDVGNELPDEFGSERGETTKVGDDDHDQTAEGQQTRGGNRRNKSWFVKVASNFLRILNGLRSTISDVGQLDISENDYQDKQLELLAGKIDNWQRYNNSEASAVSPAPTTTDQLVEDQTSSDPNQQTNKASEGDSQQHNEQENNPSASAGVQQRAEDAQEQSPAAAVPTDVTAAAKAQANEALATKQNLSRNKRSLTQQAATRLDEEEAEEACGGEESGAKANNGGDEMMEVKKSGGDEEGIGQGRSEDESRASAGSSVRQTTADSTQSNRTVINNLGATASTSTSASATVVDANVKKTSTANGSDTTSGDESFKGADAQSLPGSEAAADKAAALEQVELALNSGGGDLSQTTKGRNGVIMISSSTSIDDNLLSPLPQLHQPPHQSGSRDSRQADEHQIIPNGVASSRVKDKDAAHNLDIRVC